MPGSWIACRVASYAPYEHLAFEHLASLGIRFVEVPLPTEDLPGLVSRLRHFGLQVSTVQGVCDVTRDDAAAQIESQVPALQALGARYLFVSVQAGSTPRELVWSRLRRAGDVGCKFGVTICLETHPDLVTNAEVGLKTMEAVDHPNVRINFDTANVYFYNEGASAVSELRRLLPFVASVHLKDTDGGYRHWHFPALGRGVVDFRAIFELLDGAGFAGPCTLEIEGIEGETRTERLVCDRIAESVGFLRGLGRL
jgi:L-ribulose-5-phosphate 3-epimerase